MHLPAKSGPFLLLRDGTQEPFSSFTSVAYVIHDASRIGLANNYILADCESDNIIIRRVGPYVEGQLLNACMQQIP